MVKIEELNQRKKKSDKKKEKFFKKQYKKVEKLIKLSDNQGLDFCNYNVPAFKFGEVEYEFAELVKYLGNKVKKDGFKVGFIKPDILHILWG